MAVNPDANVYGVALLLALASGFLFGAVPVRQVLRTDPYEIVKSGSPATVGGRITVRDLAAGRANCDLRGAGHFFDRCRAWTASRSLHGNFGFEPQNAVLADTDLSMAGYSGDAVLQMQKRMIDAVETIPGVTSVGLIVLAPLVSGGYEDRLSLPTTTRRPEAIERRR